MERFDACCGSKDFKKSGRRFPNYIELGFIQTLVFFTSAEVHGADIRRDAFSCPAIFDKRVRSDSGGSPKLNFLP